MMQRSVGGSGDRKCALETVTEEGVVGRDKRGHLIGEIVVAPLRLSHSYVCSLCQQCQG